MTNSELWAIFVDKNPKMAGADSDHITLTVRGLRKIFDQAYDQGHSRGFENGKAHQKMREEKENKPSNSTKAFTDLFGKDNPFA